MVKEKKFLLNLPFYENNGDGNQCATIGMKIAMKFFTNQEVDLDKLDEIVGRPKGKWTWNQQIAYGLYKLGLEVKFYSNEELQPYLQGIPFFKKRFGKSADKIINNLNIKAVLDSTEKCLELGLFEKIKLTIYDLEKHLQEKHVVLVPVDWNIIKGKKDTYQGHILILTGYDAENIYAHNSGPTKPEKNMKINKKIFNKAWACNEVKNTAIIVFGKRD